MKKGKQKCRQSEKQPNEQRPNKEKCSCFNTKELRNGGNYGQTCNRFDYM